MEERREYNNIISGSTFVHVSSEERQMKSMRILPFIHPVDNPIVHGIGHCQPIDAKVDMLNVREMNYFGVIIGV